MEIKTLKKTSWSIVLMAFFALNVAYAQDIQVVFDEDEIPPTTLDTLVPTVYLPATDTLRTRIIEKARQYIGVSYRYGQSNENGFDCSGFVKYVYGNFGYELPHSSYEQYHKTQHLDKQKAQPGDLVFFITYGHHISHVGIYIGDNTFIHSPSRGRSVCIDSLDSDYYRRHLVGFGSVLKKK